MKRPPQPLRSFRFATTAGDDFLNGNSRTEERSLANGTERGSGGFGSTGTA